MKAKLAVVLLLFFAPMTVAKVPQNMVFIPAGFFSMGSEGQEEDEAPVRKVYVKAFYIDKYETTNAEYDAFVKAKGHKPPPNWKNGKYSEGKANHPVTMVTWEDAAAYARWKGKRLPTEEEWEKAARGADKRTFPWGNEWTVPENLDLGGLWWFANTKEIGLNDTYPVGKFSYDVSPYGVYDMAGNVREWVDNWYGAYPGNKKPSEKYGQKFKTMRGGSYQGDLSVGRCSNRFMLDPREGRMENLGFRLAY